MRRWSSGTDGHGSAFTGPGFPSAAQRDAGENGLPGSVVRSSNEKFLLMFDGVCDGVASSIKVTQDDDS